MARFLRDFLLGVVAVVFAFIVAMQILAISWPTSSEQVEAYPAVDGWRGTWQPDMDRSSVKVLMHYTHQRPVPCGKHTTAMACAHTTDRSGSGDPVCTISVAPVTKNPTDRQLQTLGHEFLHCIRGHWHSDPKNAT